MGHEAWRAGGKWVKRGLKGPNGAWGVGTDKKRLKVIMIHYVVYVE